MERAQFYMPCFCVSIRFCLVFSSFVNQAHGFEVILGQIHAFTELRVNGATALNVPGQARYMNVSDAFVSCGFWTNPGKDIHTEEV